MLKTGKNLDDLQDINRAHVIRYLAMHEGCSRVDLAKATGLKQASITKIIHSLRKNGIVYETGFTEGLKGRRSIGLSLNYSKYFVIGVKLSWERLSVRVYDLKAKTYSDLISFAYGYLTQTTADIVVGLAADTIKRLRQQFPNAVAVGLAVPGPFHRGDGAIYIRGEGNGERIYYPFLDKLRALVDIPVIIDHDANAGALGYWWHRTNCDTRIALLFLLASEGIGGGVVAKGQIFTGQRGHSAEMGHILVDFDGGGRECLCGGHGCLDAYSSSRAVESHARNVVGQHPDSELARCENITIDRIFEAMNNNDPFAGHLIREAGKYLGLGLAELIPVFDPDLVVVSDLMARGGDTLLEGINMSLDRHLSPFYNKPELVLADPSDDLVLLGAATIAIDRIFTKPTEFLMPRNTSRSARLFLGSRSAAAAAPTTATPASAGSSPTAGKQETAP